MTTDERAEQRRQLSVSLPALALVIFIVLVPFVWLGFLSFLDNGAISMIHYDRIIDRSYWLIFRSTFELAFVVTTLCVVIGYPLAYFLAQLPQRAATVALFFVLLPFWMSLLVRTYAWVVLLQRNGIVNRALLALNWIDEPLPLVFNFVGTVIGMVHVLLPFIVLSLFSTMRHIDRDYLQAAASLGASPIRAFWQVFFPLSLPSLFTNIVLIFVLSLGFYVTPAILGGGKVMTWALKIADSVNVYGQWGAASAQGVVLLVATFGLFVAVKRAFGIDRARMVMR